MKKKLALCLVLVLVISAFPALAWDRSNDYEDFSASYASSGEVILRDMDLVEGSDTYSYSYDGAAWSPIQGAGPFSGGDSRLVPYNGRSFMIMGSHYPLCCASEDGVHWRSMGGKDWFENAGIGRGITDFYFQWTGSEYVMCQNNCDPGGMYGFGAQGPSKRNSIVCFLDENFDETGEYDFGVNVADVGYAYGTYYAKTSGDAGTVIYSSADKNTWVKTQYSEIPKEPPREFKVTREGDSFSGGLLFRVSGGNVLVSADGVSFGTLGSVPESAGLETSPESAAKLVKAYVGRDGVILLYPSGEESCFSRSALDRCLPADPVYVTLDGSYLSFDVGPLVDGDTSRVLVPLRGIAQALGFTVTWESDKNLAVCTKGDTEVTVSIGGADAWVNGEHRTLEAPARVENSRTYVPIRFLAEAFGLTVDWKQEDSTVVLTKP